MRIVDANVLLYAVNADSANHEQARSWLDHRLSGGGPVGFSWIVLLAFLRLSTKRGIFESPLSVDHAAELVDEWLAQPPATLVHPGPRHADLLVGLLREAGTGANLVNDAHLAALAIEQRARVVTFDADFGRFAGVRWERPRAPHEPQHGSTAYFT